METLTLETTASPRVIIQSVEGDLRLVGQPGRVLEAQAPSRGQLTLREEADRIELSCRAGCLVFLPHEAIVEADMVAGDLHLTGVQGRSLVTKIGGDARLRRTGEVRLGRLGGDLSVDRLAGGLGVDSVGGDADVREVRGDLHIGSVGGGLRLKLVDGAVVVEAVGDISARFAPPPETTSRLRAGGDLKAVLPGDTSAVVRVTAEGDVTLPNPSDHVVVEGPGVICCGSGSASIELICQGDLSLRLGGIGAAGVWSIDLQEEINARVNTSIAEMEASLEELGLDSLSIDSERIGHRVRKAVARAVRAASGGVGTVTEADQPGRAARAEPAGRDEESMAVLRMLEQGKINAGQAEALLRALEDEG